MELNIESKSKNELKIKIIGEGHTFCNALFAMFAERSRYRLSRIQYFHTL